MYDDILAAAGLFAAPTQLGEIEHALATLDRQHALLDEALARARAAGADPLPHARALAACDAERAFLARRREEELAHRERLQRAGPPTLLEVLRTELDTFLGRWPRTGR